MEETHKNMLEKVEKWGDSVEAAVKLALNDLKLTRDEVDVEVLEQPTRGFFGFHKKLAKVRVTRKQPEPEAVPPEEPEIAVEEPVKEPVRVPDAESVPETAETGTFLISISGHQAKGSVSFTRIPGEMK